MTILSVAIYSRSIIYVFDRIVEVTPTRGTIMVDEMETAHKRLGEIDTHLKAFSDL